MHHPQAHLPEPHERSSDGVVVGGQAVGEAIAAKTIRQPMRDLARALDPVIRRVRALHRSKVARSPDNFTRN